METYNVPNLDAFNAYFGQPTCHAQVGIGDLSRADASFFRQVNFGMYCVVLLDSSFGKIIKCGRTIEYKPGTIFTMKPGDTVRTELEPGVTPRGHILGFRPELISNTGLGRDFYMFNFFDFDTTEALELNVVERDVMMNCFKNINAELHAPDDELTGHMLRLGIGQMLSYCKRYYERQFDTGLMKNSDLARKLSALMDSYYANGNNLPFLYGPPSVAWCAEQFNLSPNYFGNLIKRELHISAQEFIQDRIVEKAKSLLAIESLNINEVASQLGFSYPNHFTRLFHRRTGISPSQFRKKLI